MLPQFSALSSLLKRAYTRSETPIFSQFQPSQRPMRRLHMTLTDPDNPLSKQPRTLDTDAAPRQTSRDPEKPRISADAIPRNPASAQKIPACSPSNPLCHRTRATGRTGKTAAPVIVAPSHASVLRREVPRATRRVSRSVHLSKLIMDQAPFLRARKSWIEATPRSLASNRLSRCSRLLISPSEATRPVSSSNTA